MFAEQLNLLQPAYSGYHLSGCFGNRDPRRARRAALDISATTRVSPDTDKLIVA